MSAVHVMRHTRRVFGVFGEVQDVEHKRGADENGLSCQKVLLVIRVREGNALMDYFSDNGMRYAKVRGHLNARGLYKSFINVLFQC